jgi:hypothetical protein
MFLFMAVAPLYLRNEPQANPGKSAERRPSEAISAYTAEERDAAKQRDIRKLLKITGAGQMGMDAIDQMLVLQRQANPEIPEQFWIEFRKEISANGLTDLIIPSYEKYFTHEDIKDLIDFYESPVGRKMLENQPQLVAESKLAGQQWGSDVAQRVMARLEKSQREAASQPVPQPKSDDF